MKAISASIIVVFCLWALLVVNTTHNGGDILSKFTVLTILFASVFVIAFAAWFKEMNKPN